MKRELLALVCGGAVAAAITAQAITVGPFGPHGEGGEKNGQIFLIGTGGSVFELDGFVQVVGLDLNGGDLGTTAQLSRNSLPPGLNCQFSSVLSSNAGNLLLTYRFSNTTNVAFSDVRFAVLLDAEIDQAKNTFFNEYGTPVGTAGKGAWDAAADQWQIDEPGFQTGTLFRNLFTGTLSNSNSVPQTALNDVSMALGWSLGKMNPGDVMAVRVMISEQGDSLGGFALAQHDSVPSSTTVITFSGAADVNTNVVPLSDVTGLMNLSFQWRLNRPSGSLIGTLTLSNPVVNGAVFGPPFQLGFPASTNFYYVHPSGTLDNGLSYFDLTSAILAQLGSSQQLGSGQTVVVDGIEMYSRTRVAPPLNLFQIWSTRLK